MRTENRENFPVVCLHGSAGNSGMWTTLREAVRGRAEVIAPDAYGFENVLKQISDIASPFHLVGHGYGGAVAARIAARYPEKVASLVLYEPTIDQDLPCGKHEVPLRVISGTRSWSVAQQGARYLANCFRNSSLLQLFGMRHMAPLTHPELISRVIVDYILPARMPGEAGPAWERAA